MTDAFPWQTHFCPCWGGVGWDLARHCSDGPTGVHEFEKVQLAPPQLLLAHTIACEPYETLLGMTDFSFGDKILSTVDVYSRPNKTECPSHPHNSLNT